MMAWLEPALWLLGLGVTLICLYHVIRLAVRAALAEHHERIRSNIPHDATGSKPDV